jgi:signal transduction histidine kinase
VHRLLERQIKRFLGDPATLPQEWAMFIAAVDEAYNSADAERLMIERSLDLMSKELTEANAGLRNQLSERQRTELALLKEKEEQRALIRKLEDVHSQLLQSEKMASIGQLAAGVAHEINNPIGFVYSNLGTLEKYVQDVFCMIELYGQAEDSITDPEVLNRLQAAREKLDLAYLKTDLGALMNESKDGITRVKVIVQNLKDFSHADVSDEWRFSDLHMGLDSTLSIVNNEIKYKADVIKEYGDIPNIECLPSQLNQVFMNLLVNAAHAIEEHGTITIRSGVEKDEVWVDIVDTGQGIPSENLQKIFDPFFTTKPIGKGTGLGLSLAYGIIQKHHGRIEVKSEVGKGSAFRIWLPVHQQQMEII